jgi:hypothetical protein
VGRVVADRTDHNRDDDDGEGSASSRSASRIDRPTAASSSTGRSATRRAGMSAALKVRNLGVRHTCGAGEGGHGGAEERDEPAKEDRGSAAPL